MQKRTRNSGIVASSILIAAFAQAITCRTALADATWTITRLTTDWANFGPDIAGTDVVWQQGVGYNPKVIMSNWAGQLSSSSNAAYEPAISYGRNVAWIEIGTSGTIQSNWAGQLWDAGTSSLGPPAISGRNVVWSAPDTTVNHDWEIYRNFGGQFAQVTNNDTQDMWPDISGENIAWVGRDPDGSGCNMVLTNHMIGSNGSGTLPGSVSPFAPAISGTNIVWATYDAPDPAFDREIFSNFGGQLTHDQWNDGSPDVSGTNVVWLKEVGSAVEIWTNFGGRVISGPGLREPAISGTSIVWSSNDNHIYMATYSGGLTADDPLLPSHVDAQGWHFSFDATPSAPMYVDPLVAIGYDYFVDLGPNFSSVLLPSAGDNFYSLWLWDAASGDWFNSGVVLTGGSQYSFGSDGVDRFRILGIELMAGLDPLDTTAFMSGLWFTDPGLVSMRQVPISFDTGVVPLPGAVLLGILGLGAAVWRLRDCA